MSASVYCYPTMGKQKAIDICQAFADGAGGELVLDGELRDGPAMFFGVNKTNVHLWRQVKAEKIPFYFADNSYFDGTRGRYFRVTKNRLQHSGEGQTDGERFNSLGIVVSPWREGGEWVVVCPQSDDFMNLVVGQERDWFCDTVAALEPYKRRLRVRPWSRDKGALSKTLEQDLDGAKCLVTWSSATAITAALHGVPVVVGSKDCAAQWLSGCIYGLDHLPRIDGRERWAGVLADNQFTIDEMRSGFAWRALQ